MMTRHSYFKFAALLSVLIPTLTARAQDFSQPPPPEQTNTTVLAQPLRQQEFFSPGNVSPLSGLAPARLDAQTVQTATQTNNNSGYVFPDTKKRFRRYVKSTVGPFSLLRSAASAGLQQWDNSPLEWGQGMDGYGKRFASSIGSNAIRQTVTYGLSEAFKLDTGFEKSKHTKFWPRLKDALVQNVTSRTRSGKRVLSVPIFAGAYAGSIIPNETWYPERYSYKDGLRGGSYSLLAGFGVNLVREFVFNW